MKKTKVSKSIDAELREAAKPDIEAAIEKHGFEAVRWCVNRHAAKVKLQRELAETKRQAEDLERQISEA